VIAPPPMTAPRLRQQRLNHRPRPIGQLTTPRHGAIIPHPTKIGRTGPKRSSVCFSPRPDSVLCPKSSMVSREGMPSLVSLRWACAVRCCQWGRLVEMPSEGFSHSAKRVDIERPPYRCRARATAASQT
jgi:hypothetical protein